MRVCKSHLYKKSLFDYQIVMSQKITFFGLLTHPHEKIYKLSLAKGLTGRIKHKLIWQKNIMLKTNR